MKKLLAMLLALVMALSVLTLAVFAEPNTTDEEPETPDTTVVEEPKDNNPPTGIALMVLPMVMAGAAVAFSKKH